MLTVVNDLNFLYELDLDQAIWLIINLGTIFKIM